MDFCRARDDVDGRTNAAAPAQDPAISLTDQRELFTTDGPRLQKDDVCAARRFDDRLLASGCVSKLVRCERRRDEQRRDEPHRMELIHGLFSLADLRPLRWWRGRRSRGGTEVVYSSDGYHALRNGSALVRRGDRGVLRVSGADRLIWLQGLLTNDVAGLKPGDSVLGVSHAAGPHDPDMRVANEQEHTYLKCPLRSANHCARDSIRFSSPDAQIADISTTTAIIDVHGPHATLPSSLAFLAAFHDSTRRARPHCVRSSQR